MLKTIMKNDNKGFTNIAIFSLRSQIMVFTSVFCNSTQNFLPALLQVRVGQN